MTAMLTDREIQTARERAGMNKRLIRQTLSEPKSDGLAPARGIMIGILVGSALWVVIGLVIWFTFF